MIIFAFYILPIKIKYLHNIEYLEISRSDFILLKIGKLDMNYIHLHIFIILISHTRRNCRYFVAEFAALYTRVRLSSIK